MPVPGGGFDQCYNAQAVVATGSLLVVASEVVQAPNDKQQLAPMLEKLRTLPEALGLPQTLLADNGYFSATNVAACQVAKLEPLIAAGRQPLVVGALCIDPPYTSPWTPGCRPVSAAECKQFQCTEQRCEVLSTTKTVSTRRCNGGP
jgi:hypothetical protein